MTSAPAPPEKPRGLTKSMLARYAFLVVAFAAAAWAIIGERHKFVEAAGHIEPGPLLLAGLLTLLAAIVAFPVWRELLASLGSVVRLRQAGRVFFVGQLGKYIPGGVWNIVAQAAMARELKVPRSRTAAAGLLALVISLPVVAGVGSLCLAFTGPAVLGHYWWLPLLATPLLLALHPAVLDWLTKLAGRLLKREIPLERVPGLVIARVTAWTVLGQVLSGLQLLVLVRMFIGTYPSVLLCIGVFCLAQFAGMVVVIAPAGAGPKEVIITLGLAKYLAAGPALLVALLARGLALIADLLLAGVSQLLARNAPRDLLPSEPGSAEDSVV